MEVDLAVVPPCTDQPVRGATRLSAAYPLSLPLDACRWYPAPDRLDGPVPSGYGNPESSAYLYRFAVTNCGLFPQIYPQPIPASTRISGFNEPRLIDITSSPFKIESTSLRLVPYNETAATFPPLPGSLQSRITPLLMRFPGRFLPPSFIC